MNIKQKLEKELSSFLGLKNAVLFGSCRNALYTLLLSLKLKETDEVIVQSFICESVIGAARRAGARPVLVDVNEKTFNLDYKLVEKNIHKNTKAIIFVHTYGNPSGISEIKQLCEKYNLILIEDIAHALGASYGGKLAGTFGDYAVYSFTKQMVNFGGGAVITNQDVQAIRDLRDSFQSRPSSLVYIKRLFASLYETRAFFISKVMIYLVKKKEDLKLTNSLDQSFECSRLEAYFALRQINCLKDNIQKRKRNFFYLNKKIVAQIVVKDAESSFNYLSFIFPSGVERNKALKNNFLFSPPWSGSAISERIAFVPNSPQFTRRKLDSFWNAYHKNL
ncbi:MAG: aminotransferase class I/II-fold pyridoxal phosphate-dependent enzyme [Nanoarchaeota archaeon]